MTADEDRTRVVSPHTLPSRGSVATGDDDDRTAVMSAAARVQALDAAALARAPLDFDLTGGGDEEEEAASHATLDFDLTGGHEIETASSPAPLDLDLGGGEVSIPAAPAATPAAAISPTSPQPGVGKWIAIALAIAAAILATIFLRK